MTRPTAADIIAFLSGPGLESLRRFVGGQRWFAGKARGVRTISVEDWAALDAEGPVLLLLDVDGERYYVPVAIAQDAAPDPGEPVARLDGVRIVDAHADPRFGRELLRAIAAGRVLAGRSGRIVCRPAPPWVGPAAGELGSLPVRRLSGEQSNTSIVFGHELILKSLRRPEPGLNPDVEITHFLASHTSFAHVPRLAGWIEYVDPSGATAVIGVLQSLVDKATDGWRHTIAALHALCESVQQSARAPEDGARQHAAALIDEARELGRVTGGLHAALASDASLPAFRPEPVTRDDVERWTASIEHDFERLGELAAAPAAGDALRMILKDGRARACRVAAQLALLTERATHKIRCHGDYHLGQVLKTADSFVVIDFEGEPARPLDERRAKHSGLRDAAGMLRSFNYAVHAVLREREAAGDARARVTLDGWERLARDAFLDGYVAGVRPSPVRVVPPTRDELVQVCSVFELEKACYELRYELNHRPEWVALPLAGISKILDRA